MSTDRAVRSVDTPVDTVVARAFDKSLGNQGNIVVQPRSRNTDLLRNVIGDAIQRAVEYLGGVCLLYTSDAADE